MNGYAPCGKCGKMIENIPLDPLSQEDDGYGGYWYKVSSNGANCLECGEPLIWFHVPGLAKEFFECAKRGGNAKVSQLRS